MMAPSASLAVRPPIRSSIFQQDEGVPVTASRRKKGHCSAEAFANRDKARIHGMTYEDFRELFFFGTFAPFLRALERPIAIACFLLVTFFFALPL